MSISENKDWLRISLAASVILHFIVVLWHGSAHLYIPVALSILKTVFVSVVILLLPLIGVSLLWTSRKRAAAWIITTSMLASLLFGLINHFMRSLSRLRFGGTSTCMASCIYPFRSTPRTYGDNGHHFGCYCNTEMETNHLI